MPMESPLAGDISTVPPIILLVEDDPDTRDMYSLFLESAGMWVATAANPGAAATAVAELKPDLIVTDLVFDGERDGLQFAYAVKHDDATAHVPVVLLSGTSPGDILNRADADLFLVKPVLPDDLVTHITGLLRHSRELRARNQAALARAAGLLEKSNDLFARAQRIDETLRRPERRCPSCAQPLQWVETGRVEGAEYDYYHWCDRGCGLYCYDRGGLRWIKLAG